MIRVIDDPLPTKELTEAERAKVLRWYQEVASERDPGHTAKPVIIIARCGLPGQIGSTSE